MYCSVNLIYLADTLKKVSEAIMLKTTKSHHKISKLLNHPHLIINNYTDLIINNYADFGELFNFCHILKLKACFELVDEPYPKPKETESIPILISTYLAVNTK